MKERSHLSIKGQANSVASSGMTFNNDGRRVKKNFKDRGVAKSPLRGKQISIKGQAKSVAE